MEIENVIETGKRVRRAVKNGGAAGRDEWHRLVADVEDLVKKVAHVDDEEIARDPRQGRGHARAGQVDRRRGHRRGARARRGGDGSDRRLRARESLGRGRHRRGGRHHHRFRRRSPLNSGPAEGSRTVQALIGRLVPGRPAPPRRLRRGGGRGRARSHALFVARRLILLLIAGALRFVALLMLCAWLVILAWDTPWRSVDGRGPRVPVRRRGAAALAWPALRGRAGRDALFFHRIRSELSRDRELIANAFDRDGRKGWERRNGVERHAD